MFKKSILLFFALIAISMTSSLAAKTFESDVMYRALIKSVDINDFILMAAQYHRDAVVVSKKKTELLRHALKRWEVDGDKLYSNGGKALLEMRFKNRLLNENTSFETGIYHYKTIDKNNKIFEVYMHFEDLNIKTNGSWKVVMERNVKRATSDEFNALPNW